MLGITPGALRLPLCYVQIPASGWFVGEGLDPPAGLCAAASVPGDTAPIGYCCRAGLSHPAAAAWGQAALHPTLPRSVAASSRHIPLPFNHPYQTKSRGEHFVRPGGLTSSES